LGGLKEEFFLTLPQKPLKPFDIPPSVHSLQPDDQLSGLFQHFRGIGFPEAGQLPGKILHLIFLVVEGFSTGKHAIGPATGTPPEIRLSGSRSPVFAYVIEHMIFIRMPAFMTGHFHNGILYIGCRIKSGMASNT
jgi:hypothetical protein